jgi:hypothetical protein
MTLNVLTTTQSGIIYAVPYNFTRMIIGAPIHTNTTRFYYFQKMISCASSSIIGSVIYYNALPYLGIINENIFQPSFVSHALELAPSVAVTFAITTAIANLSYIAYCFEGFSKMDTNFKENPALKLPLTDKAIRVAVYSAIGLGAITPLVALATCSAPMAILTTASANLVCRFTLNCALSYYNNRGRDLHTTLIAKKAESEQGDMSPSSRQ